MEKKFALSIFTALSVSLALAEDLTTINGKQYKNVTVSRVEPDGLVLRSKSGILKVYFSELPKEVVDKWLPPEDKERIAAERAAEGQRVIRQMPQTILANLRPRRAASIKEFATNVIFIIPAPSILATCNLPFSL